MSLLNEARENAEKLLDVLHDPADGKKPRTYRKRAHKDYLKYSRSRKHTAKKTREAIRKQLNYLKRDLEAIDAKLSSGKQLAGRQAERFNTLRRVYEQQKYMYDNKVHSVPERIVSVSQPFIRPIVRGKAGKPVEFGAKLDISVVNGWTRLESRLLRTGVFSAVVGVSGTSLKAVCEGKDFKKCRRSFFAPPVLSVLYEHFKFISHCLQSLCNSAVVLEAESFCYLSLYASGFTHFKDTLFGFIESREERIPEEEIFIAFLIAHSAYKLLVLLR